ncbi:hypothetical protein GSI_10017 [Ganoderma sinense ZZ0214-1]|uniref:Uncharacterized protein n=1 Tax=Ganoderma sinense ZZ0214-1 TaxID=1077348 RepID=A0A2G8S2A5_9APHY|nr:hypothetical protein GSI_10017 [Ganoderma sinense ZZ0214-1]
MRLNRPSPRRWFRLPLGSHAQYGRFSSLKITGVARQSLPMFYHLPMSRLWTHNPTGAWSRTAHWVRIRLLRCSQIPASLFASVSTSSIVIGCTWSSLAGGFSLRSHWRARGRCGSVTACSLPGSSKINLGWSIVPRFRTSLPLTANLENAPPSHRRELRSQTGNVPGCPASFVTVEMSHHQTCLSGLFVCGVRCPTFHRAGNTVVRLLLASALAVHSFSSGPSRFRGLRTKTPDALSSSP